MTPAALLLAETRRDGARPLLTWYDDATGERVELSVATTSNWVAKLANYLVDEWDAGPGGVVGVRLPLHWETAVVLLACWAVGAEPSFTAADPVVTFAVPGDDVGGDVVELTLAPMGAHLARLVAAQPDAFTPVDPSGSGEVAAARPVPDGARVLSTLPYDTATGLSFGLLGPLAHRGSMVLCGHPDEARLADRCAVERVTHTAGVDVPGVPRLDGKGSR